jgi:hypothetical protein
MIKSLIFQPVRNERHIDKDSEDLTCFVGHK